MPPTIPRVHVVLFTVMFLAVMPVVGQNKCMMSDTIEECLDRYHTMNTDDYMAQERKEFQEQPTGADTGGASLSTNTKDFSPLMALAALLGQGTSDGSGTMVFDVNFPFSLTGSEKSRNAKLQGIVNTQSELSGGLRKKLLEQGHDDLIEPLEGKIDGLADYAIRFTYSLMNDDFGRGFTEQEENFRELCDSGWMVSLEERAQRELGGEEGQRFRALEETERFSAMPSEMGEYALKLTEKTAREIDMALDSYHMLLDNQPQLYITAEQKFRDPLIGPDELAVTVTYEWSRANFKTAWKSCENAKKGESCLDEYTEYVTKNQEAIEAGNRISFSGEYFVGDGEAVDVGLSTPVTLDSVRRIVLKAGWSRRLWFGNDEPIKMDLVASYEDVSDDPLLQDRGVASLTFTRKVGDMEIPLGIVYANHGAFLGEVDARLSAHLGLQFKMRGGNQ